MTCKVHVHSNGLIMSWKSVRKEKKDENRIRKKQVGITRELANCNLTKIKIYKWAHTKFVKKCQDQIYKLTRQKYYNWHMSAITV